MGDTDVKSAIKPEGGGMKQKAVTFPSMKKEDTKQQAGASSNATGKRRSSKKKNRTKGWIPYFQSWKQLYTYIGYVDLIQFGSLLTWSSEAWLIGYCNLVCV